MLFLFSVSANAETVTYFVIKEQARPFQIERDGKNHQGIVTDIVKEIFSDSGIELQIKTLPFKRMLVEMHKAADENWISYGSPAWQGNSETGIQSRFLLNEPVMAVKHILLTKADNPFSYSGPEALKEKSVVTLLGFDYPGLDQYFDNGLIQQVELKNHAAAIKSVYSDRAFGFVEMDVRVMYNLKKEGFRLEDFKQHDVTSLIPAYTIHLATGKGFNAELKAMIMTKFSEMKQSGEIDKIINKYKAN